MTIYINFFFFFFFFLTLLLFKIKIGSKSRNLPPGPRRLPLIGNLHQLGPLPHRSLWQLAKFYGPVMLLQLGRVPTLVVSSAEAAKQVLKTHDLKCCSRTPLTSTRRLTYGFLDLAFTPYGDYWKVMRKFCVLQLYSPKRVQSFQHIREQEVGVFMKKLASSDGSVELSKMVFPCTAGIICRFAFGKNFEETGLDNDRFQELLHEAILMAGSLSMADFFPSVGWIGDRLTGLQDRLERIFRELDRFYQSIIDYHLNTRCSKEKHEEHLVGMLLKIVGNNQGDQIGSIALTHQHVKAIMTNVFLGGVDSSSVCIVWAMAELARNPRAMKKAQNEVRTCIKGKAHVSETDIDQLLYLKMVMKETMRLHPPAPFLISREAMSHFSINGYNISPKTRIEVNAFAIGRDPEIWEDPEEFYPERFMDSSIDFNGQDFEFLPFGSGRRGCPGIQMGMAMVMLMMANLLYCFDWELPEGMKEEDIDMEELPGLVTHKKTPLVFVPIKYCSDNAENVV